MSSLAAAAMLLATTPATAQSVRATGSTSLRYVELRALVRDSVATDSTAGTALLRQLADGRIVRCIPGEEFCRDTRPGDVVSAVPMTHDLDVSAWGFGTGMRAFAQVRGRETLAGDRELWPRSDRALDLLALYAEIERPRLRVRAGRQWKVSGLGFYNFDGVDVAVNVSSQAAVEVYAGRSLVRGLNGGRTGGALESIESLSAPSAGVLFGLNARYRPTQKVAVSALYQIDFRADGRGVYSELAIANGVFNVRGGSAEASIEIDAATGGLNQAGLQLRAPPFGRWLPSAEIRRYRPYFELWTIWGAFSPIGFDEARGNVSWVSPNRALIVRGEASYRSYGGLGNDRAPDDLKTDGWGLSTNLSWSPNPEWRLETSYRVEYGVGASRRDANAAAVRQFGDGRSIAVQALVFQRLYEFRLTEGTVMGLGAEAALPVTPRAQLFAGATLYRHLDAGPQNGLDWSQRRASVRVQWTMGAEPGVPAVVTGGAR